jgi:hypothetical protein
VRLDIREDFKDDLMRLDALSDMQRQVERWTGTRPTELWVTLEQRQVLGTLMGNLMKVDLDASPRVFGMRVVVADIEWAWPEVVAA